MANHPLVSFKALKLVDVYAERKQLSPYQFLLKMQTEELSTIWLCANTPSMHAAHLRSNPKAGVYFVDPQPYGGLMLAGEAEVLEDPESKNWDPRGVTDRTCCVLCFRAERRHFYHGGNHLLRFAVGDRVKR